MMTLRRFRAMADIYGADLRRWPEEVRGEAEALVTVSLQARTFLDEARRLDDAIEAASAHEDAVLWRPGEQDAALARLRSGVEARIAASARRLPAAGGGRGILSLRLRWLGMATGGGFAVMAGLLIGALYVSAPEPEGVLMLLQPAPIQVLAD